jgi:hypothetical protein
MLERKTRIVSENLARSISRRRFLAHASGVLFAGIATVASGHLFATGASAVAGPAPRISTNPVCSPPAPSATWTATGANPTAVMARPVSSMCSTTRCFNAAFCILGIRTVAGRRPFRVDIGSAATANARAATHAAAPSTPASQSRDPTARASAQGSCSSTLPSRIIAL